MKTYKVRIAERKRVREKRRARIERGAVDVPEEPGNKNDEQVAVRQCGRIWRLHHREPTREKRMRGIRVSQKRIRGSERRTIGRM